MLESKQYPRPSYDSLSFPYFFLSLSMLHLQLFLTAGEFCFSQPLRIPKHRNNFLIYLSYRSFLFNPLLEKWELSQGDCLFCHCATHLCESGCAGGSGEAGGCSQSTASTQPKLFCFYHTAK